MKSTFARLSFLFCVLFLALPSLHAKDQILIIGDSLSKEYKVEFAASQAINWIEILDDVRNDYFDMGSFSVYPLDTRGTGHEYNWAIPGATSADFVDLLTGGSFFQDRVQDEIKDQLRKEVDRAIVFLGGNDLEPIYGRIYRGDDPEPLIARIERNIIEVVDWVISKSRSRNPDLEICLVTAPHIGATPKIKREHPPHEVKTQQVTDAIIELNRRLKAAADERDIAFADVYTLTEDLLDSSRYCYAGFEFLNRSADDGTEEEYLWLGGFLSADFHPNTIGQALVANDIIDAFNEHYDARIQRLGGTEILSRILGRNADFDFDRWIQCYNLQESAPDEDPDRDGLTNLAEFALDMEPARSDAALLPLSVRQLEEIPGRIEFRYRVRRRDTAEVTIIPQRSIDLIDWTDLDPAEAVVKDGAYVFEEETPEKGEVFFRLQITPGES
ncbi:MAG: GDSL-type esterase/lipase family protein [Verrucomicrobiota bacterium]